MLPLAGAPVGRGDRLTPTVRADVDRAPAASVEEQRRTDGAVAERRGALIVACPAPTATNARYRRSVLTQCRRTHDDQPGPQCKWIALLRIEFGADRCSERLFTAGYRTQGTV